MSDFSFVNKIQMVLIEIIVTMVSVFKKKLHSLHYFQKKSNFLRNNNNNNIFAFQKEKKIS